MALNLGEAKNISHWVGEHLYPEPITTDGGETGKAKRIEPKIYSAHLRLRLIMNSM